ncbi:MAG: regulatory signaling modulator protein AmpE [Burkholderiales bacterium]|nr:regulatory signaling modulator protein AmpE [Burkholderiales bacterium]
MTLFAILAALLWDLVHPLRDPSPVQRLLERYTDWLLEHLNAGATRYGVVAWAAAAVAAAALAALVGWLLGELWGVLAWGWSVVVLYYCLGMRQFALAVEAVVHALRQGDLTAARNHLMSWRPGTAQAMDEEELARSGIEHVLLLGLTRLFGVLFWFALLGVFGAVLYRLSGLCRERWAAEPSFCAFPRRFAFYLDWLPARVAAFSFAIVGDFEGALACWRRQAGTWGEPNEGVVLAAGAGALGVRLGGAITLPAGQLLRPELGCGAAPTADDLEGAMHLVWRVVVLWLGVLGLLWIGGL